MSAPLLTDEQILKAVREAVQGDTLRLTRDVGPYEVTQPTHDAIKLVRAIESAVRAPLLAVIDALHTNLHITQTALTLTQADVERLTERLATASAAFEREQNRADAAEVNVERLTAELAEVRKALKLVQQHHATAWNRGHTMGMAANRDIARQAQEAVARDAWGNAQLTEALLAAEAERDAALADAERYRWLCSYSIHLSPSLWQTGVGFAAIPLARTSNGRTDKVALDAAIDAARSAT